MKVLAFLLKLLVLCKVNYAEQAVDCRHTFECLSKSTLVNLKVNEEAIIKCGIVDKITCDWQGYEDKISDEQVKREYEHYLALNNYYDDSQFKWFIDGYEDTEPNLNMSYIAIAELNHSDNETSQKMVLIVNEYKFKTRNHANLTCRAYPSFRKNRIFNSTDKQKAQSEERIVGEKCTTAEMVPRRAQLDEQLDKQCAFGLDKATRHVDVEQSTSQNQLVEEVE